MQIQRFRLRQEHRFEAFFLTAFFASALGLAALFPSTGDDWAWGAQVGTDRLGSFFQDYNGRYAGDLLVILMTKVTFIAPFIVAATLTLTIFLILDLTDNRTALGYLSVVLLFLLMPLGTWRQSVVWTSGFANYAISGLCILIYFRSLKLEWTDSPRRRAGVGRLFAVFAVGLISALFMEHVTLYLVAASITALILVRWRFGRISPICFTWALSYLCGAALMFSNGAYRAAAANPENYQQIQTNIEGSGPGAMVTKVADVISTQAVIDNAALNFVIISLVCLLLGQRADTLRKRTMIGVFCLIGLFFTISYALPIAQEHLDLRLRVRTLNGVGAVLLLAILVFTAFALVKTVKIGFQILAGCASIVVLIAPLLIVNPINPRCFYPTYVVFLIIASLLVKESLTAADLSTVTRLAAPILGVLVVAIASANFMIYGIVHHVEEQRVSLARAQIASGATSIEMERLPFYGYVHAAEPDENDPLWMPRFKAYYGFPETVKITFVSK